MRAGQGLKVVVAGLLGTALAGGVGTASATAQTAPKLPQNAGPKSFTLYHGGSEQYFKNARAVRAHLRFAYLPKGYKLNRAYNDFDMQIKDGAFSAPTTEGINLYFEAQYSRSPTVPAKLKAPFSLVGTYDHNKVTVLYNESGAPGSSSKSGAYLFVVRISNGYVQLGYTTKGDDNGGLPTSGNALILKMAEGITGTTTKASAHWKTGAVVE